MSHATSTPSIALTLLRLTPLITASLALMSATDQHLALSTFLSSTFPPLPSNSKHLPAYFGTFFDRGVPPLGIIYLLGIAALLTNLYRSPSFPSSSPSPAFSPLDALSPLARNLYRAQLFFTLAHGFLAPWEWGHIQGVRRMDADKGENFQSLRRWLDVNWWRMGTAEVPAWACAVAAAVSAVRGV